MKKLRHPNIVTFIGFKNNSNELILFMQLYDCSLLKVIEDKWKRNYWFSASDIQVRFILKFFKIKKKKRIIALKLLMVSIIYIKTT